MLIVAALIIGGYTNHAGNVVAGWPVKLTSAQVVLEERVTNHLAAGSAPAARGTAYPLSIFPEPERLLNGSASPCIKLGNHMGAKGAGPMALDEKDFATVKEEVPSHEVLCASV